MRDGEEAEPASSRWLAISAKLPEPPGRARGLECVCREEVQALPTWQRELEQEDVAEVLVDEAVVSGTTVRVLDDDVVALGVLQRVEQRVIIGRADRGEELEREDPADHRRRGEHLARRRLELVQPPPDEHRHRARHLGLAEAAGRAPPARVVEQPAGLQQVTHGLLGEERVAVGLGVHEVDECAGRCAPDLIVKELGDVLAVERRQQDLGHVAQAGEVRQRAGERTLRRQVGGSIRADHQDALGDQLRGEMFQEQQRRLVRPVEILVQQDLRSDPGRSLEELADAVEHVAALLLRREVGCPGDVAVALTQRGHQRGDLRRVLAQYLPHPFPADLPCRLLQLVDERLVRRRHRHVQARPGEDVQSLTLGLVERLGGQPRLAGTGLAADEDESSHPAGDSADQVEQPRPLGHTTDVRRHRDLLDGRHLGVVARHLVQVPRRGDPLEIEHPPVVQLVTCRSEHHVDSLRGEDPTGRSEALDPPGDDHRLAVDVAVLLDDLPGVQPDAHVHRPCGLATVAPGHVELDLAGTVDRSARRREHGHQPVAELLDEHAAMGLDALQRQPLGGPPDRSRFLVAEQLVELRRLDQVGEQHRDGSLRDVAAMLHRVQLVSSEPVRAPGSTSPETPSHPARTVRRD